MTIYQIYDLASYIAGKFMSGQAIPPARLNLLLPQCQDEWYLTLMNEIIAASVNLELLNKVLSTTPLRPFKKPADIIITSTTGAGSLPADYNRYITVAQKYDHPPTAPTGSTTPKRHPIEIVSEDEFVHRQSSVFTRADEKPFGKITATGINVVPYNIGTIAMEYFRPPLVPVFDWCQDATNPNKIIYMPAGSYLVYDPVTPKWDLYYDNGTVSVLLYSNVIKTGATQSSPAYTSLTVELEWENIWHNKFVFFILSKIGINLSELDVAKYALEMSKT